MDNRSVALNYLINEFKVRLEDKDSDTLDDREIDILCNIIHAEMSYIEGNITIVDRDELINDLYTEVEELRMEEGE